MKFFGRDFIRNLKEQALQQDAHSLYSPSYRPMFSPEEIAARNPKLAAVNVMFYLKESGWHFPLIVRSVNEKDRHSGQVSLPGGKREDSDKNFGETAIRETSEEIGIDGHYIRIIRELSPIYIPPSNFFVHPFISFTKKNPRFSLQEQEATALIEVPVTKILDLGETPEMRVPAASRGVEVPVINIDGHLVWGATAMILSELRQILKNL